MVKLASYTLPSDLEQLGEEIAELAAHLQVVTYLLLVRLREFDAREGWSGGFRSCAHWLSWRTGIELGAAREKVRVARACAGVGGGGRVARAARRTRARRRPTVTTWWFKGCRSTARRLGQR